LKGVRFINLSVETEVFPLEKQIKRKERKRKGEGEKLRKFVKVEEINDFISGSVQDNHFIHMKVSA
jgi:hypothetical protein